MKTAKTTEARQAAEKTIKAENVAKIADELTSRVGDKLERLHAVLEDTAINNLRTFDDDTEHYNPYPALCLMSLSASELEAIGGELFALVKLIRELAA